jgi:hypothetical protein
MMLGIFKIVLGLMSYLATASGETLFTWRPFMGDLHKPHLWMQLQSIALLLVLLYLIIAALVRRRKRASRGAIGKFREELHDNAMKMRKALYGVFFWWFLFYTLAWFVPPADRPEKALWFAFYGHLISNVATVFLLMVYSKMAAPRRHGTKSREFTKVLETGGIVLGLSATCLEVLVCLQGQWESDKTFRTEAFVFVCGMAQSLALFLLAGRLEDPVITDHLERTRGAGALRIYRPLVFAVFAYAVIQPLYVYFSAADYNRVVSLLVIISFPLKMSLLWLFALLTYSKNGSVSPLENYLYEVERFTTEDLRSYERDFFRKYLPTRYEEIMKQKDVGFVGMEFIYPSKHKRTGLRLDRGASGRMGGMLVKNVFRGSGALKAGLRIGDFVTHVNGMPIGPNNTLTKLLDGQREKDTVTLSLLRSNDPKKADQNVVGYDEHIIHLDLGNLELALAHHDIHPMLRPYLAIEYKEQNPDAGVVIRTLDPGTKEETVKDIVAIRTSNDAEYLVMDQQALRFVAGQCVPGSTVDCLDKQWAIVHSRVAQWAYDAHSAELPRLSNKGSIAVEATSIGASNLLNGAVKRHSDRFDARIAGAKAAVLWEAYVAGLEDTRVRLLVMNTRWDIVLEYECAAVEIRNFIATSPAWNYVEPGQVHVFIGPMPEWVNGKLGTKECLFTSGHFWPAKVARSPAIKVPSSTSP